VSLFLYLAASHGVTNQFNKSYVGAEIARIKLKYILILSNYSLRPQIFVIL
jgi:hypothetical protein